MHTKGLRMCKGMKQKCHSIQARGREAQSPEESRPRQRGEQAKTEAKHFNLAQNLHGLGHKDQGR
jgi:hypothetical protein